MSRRTLWDYAHHADTDLTVTGSSDRLPEGRHDGIDRPRACGVGHHLHCDDGTASSRASDVCRIDACPTGRAVCASPVPRPALNIGVFFPLLFLTAERLPGGVAATLGATQPIIVAFLAVAIVGEQFSRWRVSWGVIGVIGVGLVVLGPGAALDPVGVLAGLAGAVSMGLGVVLTKKWGRPPGVGALALAGWQLTAGGMILLIPTLLIEGVPSAVDAPAVAGYLWLGLIGGLLAYTVWFAGIRRLPVTATALLGLLSPLVAASLGALLLKETLTPVQLAGFALALAALLAGQLTPRIQKGTPIP